MGYLHIANLYKEQTILLFRECYALEKLHGTSAHVSWNVNKQTGNRELHFFAGGESHQKFLALFDQEKLVKGLTDLGLAPDQNITIYGEAYGGAQQGMSHTYGPNLKFAVFDVQIGDCWLDVPNADDVAKKLGLEFVHWRKISTDLASLDAERDMPSVQAIRNGISTCVNLFGPVENPKPREGVVLRPLVEMTDNRGNRVICKHKGDAFKETATPRPVVDPGKMKVMEDAQAVANEWCTATRLEHVLDKLPGHSMERMREIIAAFQEDVKREAAGEVVWSDAVAKAIGKKAVDLYKAYLKSKIGA